MPDILGDVWNTDRCASAPRAELLRIPSPPTNKGKQLLADALEATA